MGYCKYCNKEVVNINIHDNGIKHMKLEHLHNYLNGLSDEREKDYIIKQIEKLKLVKNKEKSDKNKNYRKQYYKDNIKLKITKIKPEQSMILHSKEEIIRDDGSIEIQERWIPNIKFINNL
jgi:hypothetical protein